MSETQTKMAETELEGESEAVRMVLWTRRPVCGPRTDVIDRLSSMRADGTIGSFTVETWPDEVAISEHTEHARVVEVYKEYLLWAEEHNLSITPPFERRTATSLVGGTEDVLTVPIMCLAVYDNGLSGVYPCTSEHRTWSVTDYLDAYERAGGRPATAENEVESPVYES
ncbi:HTH domain-containing protein [Salinibaculum rarum]|uniref:HTH domain-containing protein n=1 Tax=Salinibaculum rarum TaxID=3058903 RepID=UPI00265F0960|nr:HTH domain-containing protein [Salinibaculum sp. KK48]